MPKLVNPKRKARPYYWIACTTVWLVCIIFSYRFFVDKMDYSITSGIVALFVLSAPVLIMNYWVFNYRKQKLSFFYVAHILCLGLALMLSYLHYPLVMIVVQIMVSSFLASKAEKLFGKNPNTKYIVFPSEFELLSKKLDQINLMQFYNLYCQETDNEKYFKLAFFDLLFKKVLTIERELGKDNVSKASLKFNYLARGRKFSLTENNPLYTALCVHVPQHEKVQDRFVIGKTFFEYKDFDQFKTMTETHMNTPFSKEESEVLIDYIQVIIKNAEFVYSNIDQIKGELAFEYLQVVAPFCLISQEIEDHELAQSLISLRKEKGSVVVNTELSRQLQLVVNQIKIIAPAYFMSNEVIDSIFSINPIWFEEDYIMKLKATSGGGDIHT